MANPRTRVHLRHYPEDAGEHLEHCWQAERWLHEIDDDLLTPMHRTKEQDFYTLEPAQLMDGSMVMPHRWFTRRSPASGAQEYYALAWTLLQAATPQGVQGYVVQEFNSIEVPASQLHLSMPWIIQLGSSSVNSDPRNIFGMLFTHLVNFVQ